MSADAIAAARLLATDPAGLGGLWLRGGDPETRDAVLDILRGSMPVRRLPINADDEALLGGIDLPASLGSGSRVVRRGLLAEAEGGAVVVGMAERMDDGAAGRIAAAMDGGAGFALVLFDDGVGDQRPPAVLTERVAFHVDLAS